MSYRIEEVRSRSAREAFIRFPEWLYRNSPHYVPALRSGERKALSHSASLSYCAQAMWLVRDGAGRVCGRICAMVNPRYNERYGTRRARFGWFDCIEDPAVAALLLGTAEDWAHRQGMDEIHGPLYYNTLGKQGLLIDSFACEPIFNTLYNFPYYKDFLEANGYVKDFDWLEHRFEVPEAMPDKIGRVAQRLLERYQLREADIDRLKQDPAFIRRFFALYNDSFDGSVAHFVPYTEAEIQEEAQAILPYVNGRYCCLLLDGNDDIAAFAIGLPNLSPALRACRGRLLPFGWIRLMRALRGRSDSLDFILVGAAPKWQNSGISALFHYVFFQRARQMGARWIRTHPQLESNPAGHVWRSYGDTQSLRRRCYIKSLKKSAANSE